MAGATPDLRSRSVLILFGTETGNSEEIAGHLGRMCERLRFHTRVEEMDEAKLNDLLHNHVLVIFVISTTGQGSFPRNAQGLWKSLRRAKLPPDCLATLNFTTFGLGDSSYPKFNWAARLLHSRLQKLGAAETFPRGEADERHDDGTDSIYRPWHQDLREYLVTNFPLPASIQPIPDDEPLPPKFVLRLATEMDPALKRAVSSEAARIAEDRQFLADRDKHAALSHTENPRSQKEQFETDWNRISPIDITYAARLDDTSSKLVLSGRAVDSLDKANILKDFPSKYLLHGPAPVDTSFPPAARLPTPHSFDAVVQRNSRVTPRDHWQDVRLIELFVDVPDMRRLVVSPGNTVTIYPKNFPQDVQWLIDRMDWANVADLPVDFCRLESREWGGKPHLKVGFPPRNLYPLEGGTFRDLLLHNMDFTAIPTRTFIQKISTYAGDARQKEKLVELTRAENTQEFYDFSSRPRRTILELLGEFDSVRIPFHTVPDIFPVIRGRDFSIANGGVHHGNVKDNVLTIEILAALVEYKTIIRKPRQGLCSRYLKHLPEGTPIRVTLRVGSPPPSGQDVAQRPLIGIATGTGIAPIRSLIYDRDDMPEKGPTLLFFGCRSRRADFYFHEEWEELDGVKVLPAFSRDPEAQDKATADPYAAHAEMLGAQDASGAVLPPPDAMTTGMLAYDYDRGKNYVQHLIRKHAWELCELFKQRAIICICGNSGRMPQSVRQALLDAAVLGGMCRDRAEAGRLFDEKNPERLYVWQETW